MENTPPVNPATNRMNEPVPNNAWQQPAPGAAIPPYGAAPVYAQQPPKKRRTWIIPLVIILVLLVIIAAAFASACSSLTSATTKAPAAGHNIGVIDIAGTIQYDGSACSPEGLKTLLDEAEESSSIDAVVLRVDSGGGTASAGEEMAAYVKDFSKPIVVSSASTNASAAYYFSSQADKIYVDKSTAIGAIGTVVSVTDVSGLLDKLGIKVDNIASAESKDSSYGTRALTEEERAYYQAMVEQINQVFVEAVADGRHMTIDEAKALATGMPFTGMTAVENGLADKVGSFEDACKGAADLAGVSDYSIYSLRLPSSSMADLVSLLGASSSTSAQKAAALESAIEGMNNDVTVR